ncbi:two-component system, response regulator YesN [Anaerocolumna jejuensis DSM 15929]|uniref:Stage 0 sporulation protein A homolog n=1 Tax=Anaerocolumna jejuensis DSM 15929 TaxID=1121322 RepID=A0A1M6QA15_9FIRM|nr:response regulator [Anaerocolumna jejuensis]SHK16937.1 two-component system, response regulator YesN [Anaerocolumna jejuensis DSM 15929]
MYRILIVDDDKLARKGLISMVPWEQCGLKVVGDVSNGAIALEFIEKNEVDVVVVDLSMPVLSGLDFIKESKKRHPDINYVVLSFHESFEYVQSALRLGALDYISKLRLEQEDCTEIFIRVSKIIDDYHKNAPQNNRKEADDRSVDGVCAEIEKAFWVYNEEVFQDILEHIQKEQFSQKQLYRIMLKMLHVLEKNFEIILLEHDYDKFDSDLIQLQNIRKDTFDRAVVMKYSGKIEIVILKSVDYILKNLTSDSLKSEKIADEMNMSRGYFSINFKKCTGFTVSNYIRKERVKLAKQILREEKITVAEVSCRVGYRDEKYFSKVFYSIEGVNCSEYRKQLSYF